MLNLKPTEPRGLVRLDKAEFGDTVRDYAAAAARQKAAEADARAAKQVADSLRGKLLLAMGDAPAAICGNAVLTVKQTAGAEAALTLKAGDKLAWSAVSGLTVGNRYVAADDIATIYGGRSGSTSLTCAGEV